MTGSLTPKLPLTLVNNVSLEEIGALIDACRGELRLIVLIAILTSADRGPIFKLRKRDVDIYTRPDGTKHGQIYLGMDTKTPGRRRSVGIPHLLGSELHEIIRYKKPNDLLFQMTNKNMDYPWQQARESIGRSDLRFKDLRHLFAILANRAGIDLNTASSGMGDTRETMVKRYLPQTATFTSDDGEKMVALLSLTG